MSRLLDTDLSKESPYLIHGVSQQQSHYQGLVQLAHFEGRIFGDSNLTAVLTLIHQLNAAGNPFKIQQLFTTPPLLYHTIILLITVTCN